MQKENDSKRNPEPAMPKESLQKTLLMSSQKAVQSVQNLGPTGKEKLFRPNRFGDIPIRADVLAEETVLHTLEKQGIPLKVISEEHGIITLGKSPSHILIFLDGIDGSSQFAQNTGRSGTMIGAYTTLTPAFEENTVSVIALYPTNPLMKDEYYYATSEGAYVTYGDTTSQPLHTADIQKVVDIAGSPICIDYALPIPRQLADTKLAGFVLNTNDSTAAQYADVASGKAAAFIGDRRKDDIELAASFRLLKEAGATILDLTTGEEIDKEQYRQIGRDIQNRPYIIAATKELAHELLEMLQG